MECKYCNKEFKPHRASRKLYCSIQCQKGYEYNKWIKEWKLGLKKGYTGNTKKLSPTIRKYMLKKYNNACIKCGWNSLHPIDYKPLVEINHIDGNAENCSEENLEVLCPNCHSITSNFRARNKISKRIRNIVEVTDTVIVDP